MSQALSASSFLDMSQTISTFHDYGITGTRSILRMTADVPDGIIGKKCQTF